MQPVDPSTTKLWLKNPGVTMKNPGIEGKTDASITPRFVVRRIRKWLSRTARLSA